MLTAEQIRRDEDLRIAQRMMGMMDRKIDMEAIRVCTDLPSTELERLSPDRKESSSLSGTLEFAPNSDVLKQSIASLTELEVSGGHYMKTTDGNALETLSPVHKRHKDSCNG